MPLTFQWFPTSCFRISSGSTNLYIDPGSLKQVAELPKADLILVTHHHWDHLRKSTVSALTKPDTKAFGPRRTLGKLGVKAMEVKAGDAFSLGDVAFKVTDAYNPPGSRRMTYHRKGVGVGYVLTIGGMRIYHAGDTGLIEEMRDLGPIDIALLPIGGRFTMDIGEAVEAVKLIQPKEVVPMHLLSADPQAFRQRVEEETPARAKVLSPGEAVTFQ